METEGEQQQQQEDEPMGVNLDDMALHVNIDEKQNDDVLTVALLEDTQELGEMEVVIATSLSKQQEGEASMRTREHEHDDDDDGFVVVRSKWSRPPSISRTSWQWERLTQRVLALGRGRHRFLLCGSEPFFFLGV